MTKLRELTYLEVINRLKFFGFRFYRQGKGSHELWVRDLDNIVIPVPHHRGKTIRKGTIRAIIREINLTVEEFMDSQ
ncbi:type II toxin-antitoxin system HicA family toxin [Aphanizomenon sp. CS-733/32]|uniref:type II toxin-antitoxin system HicA family toxin n=1 Tax=Aphanizomenon sp. CS-733/32 TaxID=3021715 RepID=UPI0023306B5A|nr:type II toxin-antitoxin system HicA family toxin [Aphanizomenon sp. CS-733/32]MDB9310429.1 type II toxin-antitoxin system HicA family toxin [Aphanizomenon sp. CS-733/32]